MAAEDAGGIEEEQAAGTVEEVLPELLAAEGSSHRVLLLKYSTILNETVPFLWRCYFL